MRLAFMGSPAFALPALAALAGAGHEIAAVYCQPPKPAMRGQKSRPCAVGAWAEAAGLPVRHPTRLRRDEAEQEAFRALELDLAVVAAYGLILPAAMLAAPRLGCWNLHASLLPRWRGAAPMQAAILAGDDETGITVMRMDEGLDTGPMLLRGTTPIGPDTTLPELHDVLAALGGGLILEAIERFGDPGLLARSLAPQPEAGACHAPKLSKADAPLDWRLPAAVLERRVRALNPWPGATATWRGETLKILHAAAAEGEGAPGGRLAGEGLRIACGEGALRIARLQRPGGRPQEAEAFLRGHPMPVGELLG